MHQAQKPYIIDPMIRIVVAAALTAASLLASDPALTKEDRDEAIKLLAASRAEYKEALKDVTLEQWKWKPAPDRWSVGEVAEHIALAESLLFAKVMEAVNALPNPDWETKTKDKLAFLARVMPNRQGKAKSPLEIEPKGNLTKEETFAIFDKGRARIEKFIQTTDVAWKEHTAEHPFPIFNTLNAQQWFLYIPWHTQRHLKQIAEVKATAGYPK